MPRAKVRIDETTWKRLNARKEPGDSFDDVIVEMLDQTASDASVAQPQEQ